MTDVRVTNSDVVDVQVVLLWTKTANVKETVSLIIVISVKKTTDKSINTYVKHVVMDF